MYNRRAAPQVQRSFATRWRRFAQRTALGKNLALAVLAFLTLYPIAMMLIVSGKDTSEWSHDPFGLTLPFHWDNYTSIWDLIRPYILT
jgi:ABC-type glycerol-3-phosphate transport system permease component